MSDEADQTRAADAAQHTAPPGVDTDKRPGDAASKLGGEPGDKQRPAGAGTAAAADNGTGLLNSQTLDQRQTSIAFINSTLNDTGFNLGSGVEQRRTWAERLIVIQREEYAGAGDESDPAFAKACEALETHRIVVLRHQQGCQERAEKLLKLVSHWASGREPSRKLLGVPNDATLPLSDLALPDEWPQHLHGSLVTLERRKEPMTTRFFSSNNSVGVRSLCQRLTQSDTRLLVALAAEWDAGEGALDPFDKSIHTLELSNAAPQERSATVQEGESAFDALPRLAAGLFEGLQVDEYEALVKDLAADLDPMPGQATVAPLDPKSELPHPKPPPTRHQRWIAGDVDRVLAELGVQYTVSGGDPGFRTGRASGYYLADARSPYGEPGWVIANHPFLLAGRIDRLLDRYLGASTSVRFAEAFMALVARLDGAGVKTASEAWLLDGWKRALAASADIDVAAEKLRALLEYLQPSDASTERARGVIDGLAATVVEVELRFQQETGREPVIHSLEALTEEGSVNSGRLWEQLISHASVGEDARRMSELQTYSIWALLRLSRRWPADAARAVAKILTDVAAPATPWRRMARELPPLDTAPRLAPLTLDHLLKLSVSMAPEVWTSFAHGVVLAFEAPVRDALTKPNSQGRASSTTESAALDGQRLAFASLYAMAPQVYGSSEEDRRTLLKLMVPATNANSEEPSLIGRLLAMSHLESGNEPALWPAGQGELPAADIVRFLRGVAVALQRDKTLPQEESSALVSKLGAGLRAMLPLKLRRDLLQQARDALDSQLDYREHLEQVGDRDAVADIKRRIRATQTIIRSLSVPAPVTA